jgi:DNA polymerase III epsilon subunit-like protein
MRATAFDTETTGLIENHTLRLAKQPEILEFAAISVDWEDLEREELARWSTLIRREGEWIAEEKKRPPISESDLANAPRFMDVADKIARILEGSDVVVGHNLSYDMEIVDLCFDRLKRKIRWPRLKVCTIEQTMFFVGKRLNLGELHLRLTGRDHKDAHRAMADTEATLACLREMRRREWV